ncbi:MAG: sensor histidine kinase [Pyrinomonadaceae bacterium]
MKLFLKIFLWFLAAIALTVVVLTFVTRTLQTEPLLTRWQRSTLSQLAFYGATASQVLDNEGEDGLRIYLDRLKNVGWIRGLELIDHDGRVLYADADIEQFSKPEARTAIERASLSGSAELEVSSEAAFGAVPVPAASGARYVLVVGWDAPRTPSMFPASWIGYGRLVGFLLTAFLVCFALARYLSSPIAKLRSATQRLAAGDLQTRVADKVGRRRDELADLARDFDVMASRIEALVTSQQRLTRDVSHELRSPLARMNVALELAKQKAAPDSQALLARIENESLRLNEMISRILTLSKLESGSDDFERTRVNLTEVVRDVAEDADFEARARGRSVRVIEADECRVVGSEPLLRSALDNVLRNAVRYTAEGTAVDVAVRSKGGRAVVTITDHGGGVPEGELKNLFTPFYRVGEARERSTGGIGLGLAIAQQAVKAHKGTIAAANRNGGLEVEIVLNCET